jgi:hypothetical protein
MAANIALELLLGTYIRLFISIRIFRYAFLALILVVFSNANSRSRKIEEIISNQLNTGKLKRAFKAALVE